MNENYKGKIIGYKYHKMFITSYIKGVNSITFTGILIEIDEDHLAIYKSNSWDIPNNRLKDVIYYGVEETIGMLSVEFANIIKCLTKFI